MAPRGRSAYVRRAYIPAHMSRSAAWRQLMTRFCGRSTRVQAAAGDLARQLASRAAGNVSNRFDVHGSSECDSIVCEPPAAGKNNLANDLTFRCHMPWTEFAASSLRVFTADLLVCGRRAGDLDRQLEIVSN